MVVVTVVQWAVKMVVSWVASWVARKVEMMADTWVEWSVVAME